MIAQTPFMLSDFHLFVLQTHNKPPSPVLPPPLFILSCCVAEVRYGHGQSGKHSGKKNPKQLQRVVGCGLPSAPGGVWGKWLRTKLQRWRTGRAWTLPCSPAQQHPSLLSSYIKVCKSDETGQISNFLIHNDFWTICICPCTCPRPQTAVDTVSQLLLWSFLSNYQITFVQLSQNWGNSNIRHESPEDYAGWFFNSLHLINYPGS